MKVVDAIKLYTGFYIHANIIVLNYSQFWIIVNIVLLSIYLYVKRAWGLYFSANCVYQKCWWMLSVEDGVGV